MIKYIIKLDFETNKCIHNIFLDIGVFYIMYRNSWGAVEPWGPTDPIEKVPLHRVIVSHTALSARCETTDDCCNMASKVQVVSAHNSKHILIINDTSKQLEYVIRKTSSYSRIVSS
jgi:hypothetical protein